MASLVLWGFHIPREHSAHLTQPYPWDDSQDPSDARDHG
jgi:hypothetical protein